MFKDFKSLLSGLISYVGERGLSDFNPGSIIRTILEAAAAMMEECYYLLSLLQPRFWVRTSTGEWLDRRAEDFGKTRKEGDFAEGTVLAGRDEPSPIGIKIPAGTIFKLESLQFLTLEDGVINVGETVVELKVQAQEIGSDFNLPEGTLLYQTGIAISGLEWIKVKKIEGGADIESDEEFRERLLTWLRNPGTSGNIADYKNWAMDIEGVTGVRVLPCWDGPGTVKIIILGADKKSPEVELIKLVQDTIAPENEYAENRLAPIGAEVTVTGAEPIEIDVTASIILDMENKVSLEIIKENFIYALREYLSDMALKTSVVRYNRIASLLTSQEGVLDYFDFKINGESRNLTVKNEQVAVAGTVIIDVNDGED